MFYSDEYASRKRPSSHLRSGVPEDAPEQQNPKRHRKKKVDKTLVSGGSATAEKVHLFQLEKASTWGGPDRSVKGSNSDGKRYFASAYMYLTRCIRKALGGDPTRDLFITVGDERVDSRVARDERDLSEQRKSIVYINAHYKTFWQHEGVRALVENKFQVRAQDQKPTSSTTTQHAKKQKRPSKKRSTTQKPRSSTPPKPKKVKPEKAPKPPRSSTPPKPQKPRSSPKPKKAPKPRSTLKKSGGRMTGPYWTFSRKEHHKVRNDLHAQSREASGGNEDVKGPSGSEIAREKGRRWKALPDEEKRKYAA